MTVANMSGGIRVFLIDAHHIILWGLERLVERNMPAMRVVGSATNCAQALLALNNAAPDLILLEIELGDENGLDVIPELIAKSNAKILVLTGIRDKSVHDRAVVAGARGVIEKGAPLDTILAAIAKVHEGQLWLDRASAGRVIVEFSRSKAMRENDSEQKKILTLTERERGVIVAATFNIGASGKMVSELLHISEHTLRNHLTSIYAKLRVANRLELFAYANQHGLNKPLP